MKNTVNYKLYAVRVFCFDWSQCIEFYKETVGLKSYYENADIGWAQFDLQGAFLGVERLKHNDPDAKTLVGRFVGVSIMVDDLEAVYQALVSRGVKFRSPPEKQSWGGALAHFEDPDANIITLLGE